MFHCICALKGGGSFQSLSSGDNSGGAVLRFETLEHSIEGAIHELECIDENPLSAGEESLTCEDSSASDVSDHEAPLEAHADEGGPPEQQPDAGISERKLKPTKVIAAAAKAKATRPKGEKKQKAKTAKAPKKAKPSSPVKQHSDVSPEPPPATITPDEPAEQERDSSESRKIKALVLKQKAERENWAARLRKAKEMGLEVISKVLL